MKLHLWKAGVSWPFPISLIFMLGLFAGAATAVTETFPSSGNWTAPPAVTSVTVEAWGGGGAGGGATNNPAKGGGGAGGQYVRKDVVTVVPGTSYAVVVGQGGTGSSGDGNAGGDSTFAGTIVVAKGGAGGTGAKNGVAGAGSSANGVGDVIFSGGNGSAGSVGGSCNNGGAGGGGAGSNGVGGNASGNTAGTGTTLNGGAGGVGRNSSGSGYAGSVAGGGGGGACAESGTDRTGGAGGAGMVIITYEPPCTPPSNIPTGVDVTCQCDTFTRPNLNPSTIFGNGNWVATSIGATNFVPKISNQGYMRLTDSNGYEATAATVPGIFPAAANYISVEFRQYAYNGSGADGMAVTLSDYAVTPQPGAFGGSLGYAQKSNPGSDCTIAGGCPGFAGGWIGVALDEFGGFQSAAEGRSGGAAGCTAAPCIKQSVGIRGSGSGTTGYPWLRGTADLTTVAPNVGVANSGSATPSLGDFYQVIVDSRGNNGVSGPALVSVNRDISGVGDAYSPLIPVFDVYAVSAAQAPVPQNWQISFTGSTGGSDNIHEIGALRICAQKMYPTTGGTPGGFNAIDEFYARSDVNAISGHLYTKRAGIPFAVNVAALNPTSSGILSSYAISGSKTVTVKLIDDSVSPSCNASTSACSSCGKPVVASQTMTFSSTNNGFKLSPNFTVPAYPNLIVQMTDVPHGGTTTGCSVDAFAVRPSGIASVTSSGSSTIKAGSNFTLTATTTGITTAIAGNPSGYADGALKINANAVHPVVPATVAGTLAGSFAAAIPGASSATAVGSAFTYSEVGAFSLLGPDFTLASPRIPGVYDDTWTAIDSGAKSDCIAGTSAVAYSNTKDSNGKYGCNFGISADTGAFGRFIPDHFGLSGSVVNRSDLASPGGTFTYMDEPMKMTLLVTAYAAGDSITENYAGTLAKLNVGATELGTGSNWFNTGCSSATECFGLGAVNVLTNPDGTITATGLSDRLAIDTTVASPSSSWTKGVGTFVTHVKLARNATPDGPYDTVRVGGMPRDSDGVTLPGTTASDTHKLDLDATTAHTLASNPDGTNDRNLLFSTKSRFGRLWLGNAYGSDLNALSLPYQFQYWNGSAFVLNTDDSLSSLVSGNLGLGNYQGAITSANMGIAKFTVGSNSNGAGTIAIAPPNAAAAGSVDVVVDLGGSLTAQTNWVPTVQPTVAAKMPYLRGKWYDTTWDRDPTARATFGIFGSSLRKGPIYIRENF